MKEYEVNEQAQPDQRHDDLRQVIYVEAQGRACRQRRSTMTATMVVDRKRVAAGGARLQWHMIPIADIDLIAKNRFADVIR